jgi:hypothetical protein
MTAQAEKVRKLRTLARNQSATVGERETATAMADRIAKKYDVDERVIPNTSYAFDFFAHCERQQAEYRAKREKWEAEQKQATRDLYGEHRPKRSTRTTFFAQTLLKKIPRTADYQGSIDSRLYEVKKFPRFHVLIRQDGVVELSLKLTVLDPERMNNFRTKNKFRDERLVALMAPGDVFAGFTYEQLLANGTGWMKQQPMKKNGGA